jgi:spore photoproduct lyase
MYSKTRTFSHIYLEDAVAGHPRAGRILDRFPGSTVIPVDDYQNVFGRGRQDFWRQKAGPKLILARKKENLIYPGNDFLQGNASPNFCYNAPVLNCPYDCHYCYLQGMYGSANIVAFVNQEDYFAAAEAFHQARPDPARETRLAISYDTDLLALEGILGYVREWVEWSRGREGLHLEIRTKSSGKRFFREIEPSPLARFAWTLSPETVARRYEAGAPPLEARIEAMREAASRGWRLALCLDPVIRIPDWERTYTAFTDRLARELPWAAIDRVEIGVFRVGGQHFKRMRRRPGTDLLHYPYEHANNAVSYKETAREEMMHLLQERIRRIISPNQIHIWT